MRSFVATFATSATACTQLLCSLAHATEPLPSHCLPDELTYLTAKMAPLLDRPDAPFLGPSTKILSICTEAADAQPARITYRYGAMGRVELQETATPRSPFWRFERSTSPHTGEELTFFRRGKYTYYIAESTGQGHGVTLKVFEAKKRIAYLFSGVRKDADYQSSMHLANRFFNSPALAYRKPMHALD
jgi:hypothetical protein